MLDALRGYLQLATGLTEVTARKAYDAATDLLSSAGIGQVLPETVSSSVSDLADDLVKQGTANREMLTGLIRTEVDRAVGRLGFVREEELAALRRHVSRLEEQLNSLRADASAARSSLPTEDSGNEPEVIDVASEAVSGDLSDGFEDTDVAAAVDDTLSPPRKTAVKRPVASTNDEDGGL